MSSSLRGYFDTWLNSRRTSGNMHQVPIQSKDVVRTVELLAFVEAAKAEICHGNVPES
jgi:hypothetical protein